MGQRPTRATFRSSRWGAAGKGSEGDSTMRPLPFFDVRILTLGFWGKSVSNAARAVASFFRTVATKVWASMGCARVA